MKPYLLWSLIAISALLHGVAFYFLSGRSFFPFHGLPMVKSEEISSISLLPLKAKEELKSQPVDIKKVNVVQEVAMRKLVSQGQETLQKVLAEPALKGLSQSSVAKNATANAAAQVFGISGEGFRFIYLLDVSGSMREKVNAQATRLAYAKSEIRRSLESLPEVAEFNILFFADEVESFSAACVPATEIMKQKAYDFLEKDSSLGGVTDIVEGLGVALAQWPDAVFLMTDGISNVSGEVFRSQWHYLYRQSRSQARICPIGFLLDSEQEKLLREVAETTKGSFWHWQGS